jgi:hypothetical protein
LLVQRIESLVRTAVFKSANALVGFLLQDAVDRADAAFVPKPKQQRKGRETLNVKGLFGVFKLQRDYYYHAGKKQGHYPADSALGLEIGYTPALARLMCLEGADEPSYLQAEEHLREIGGIEVSARQIQRVVQRVGKDAQLWQEREVIANQCNQTDASVFYVSADGTGAPMRKTELKGRNGKQADGSSKTRQAYLGCVFTQHGVDKDGHPIRDWQSTTYVSTFSSISHFGPMLRREAFRRGMGSAKQVVLLIDGAEGLGNMGKDCFKDAVQIVDFYHAMEHAGKVIDALLGGKGHPKRKERLRHWSRGLLKNQVASLVAKAQKEAQAVGRDEEVEKELGYFHNNLDRMKYGTFRKKGFFIGSGVIEAGCKTVIGTRCKQSGMFWSLIGAEHVLALRCIHTSRRLNHYWEYRLNNHAARNDSLPLAA